VIEANIERATALLELAQSRLDAGVATQIDVTRAETRVAIEEQAKLQQETVVFNSELLLKQILNLDFEEELVLEAPTISPEVSEKETISFERIQGKRSDFQREVFLLEQNELEQRAANWQRFPSIKLFGGYGYGTEILLDGKEKDTWNVGISLSIPIFEGFKIESRKQFVKSRIRAQKHIISDLKNKISTEVRLAIQDSKSRGLQIAVADKQKNLAEEELELARIRYEEGVADNREVIDAQNNLAQAEDNLVDGVYLYNLALIELARAKGDVRNILRDR
jgi:outer membrane protein TolC